MNGSYDHPAPHLVSTDGVPQCKVSTLGEGPSVGTVAQILLFHSTSILIAGKGQWAKIPQGTRPTCFIGDARLMAVQDLITTTFQTRRS